MEAEQVTATPVGKVACPCYCFFRSVCGMLKSKSSVKVDLLKGRAKDKKREEAKSKKRRQP